jgi:hypothetical protein
MSLKSLVNKEKKIFRKNRRAPQLAEIARGDCTIFGVNEVPSSSRP